MTNRTIFYTGWLKYLSIIIMIFGLFTTVTNMIQLEPSQMDKSINSAFFTSNDQMTPDVRDYIGWMYGVAGAMLISWGLLMFSLTHYGLTKKEKWVWKTMVYSLVVWFIVDQTASIFYHVWFNVIFNMVFLILYVIPLVKLKDI